ncbi:uncharacterized protein B0J16DRAFT_409922 [Fusarium flagelliforme]|nr:uncharacterized protein B0J16DRAFT_409922 [Fusarium flagelliforme]KAH7198402.1 hypothetical protein B0J16DRAFT_409922 [Fusarium flagelliforme]
MDLATILDRRFRDIRLLDSESARADMMYLLRYQLPPSTSAAEVGYYTRGLDCLLILIRLLNSFLIPLSSDNHEDAEAANPMLRLAWQNIARTESAVQDWIKVKALVLEMSKPQSVRDSKLTFEGLVFTQLVKDTFWSRKEFLLFRGFATKPEDGQYWFADKTALANQMDINTIVVDANEYEDLSFEKCVARKFDLHLIGGEWNIALCAKPYVLRVRYTRNKQHPPSFKEIKNIWVPIGHFEGHELKATEKQALYSLVAAVFLDTDQIHVYEPMGEQIVSDLRNPATRGKPWSVEDKEDGSFMLFYVPVSELEYGNLPLDTFPEVTEHRGMGFDINLE